nr:hypothetical protein 1634Bnrm3_p138 [Cryptomonas sp.]
MLNAKSIFYLLKALLSIDFVILPILIEVTTLVSEIYNFYETKIKGFSLGKYFPFYHELPFKVLYSKVKKEEKKKNSLKIIKIDRFKVIIQKIIDFIFSQIPSLLHSNSDYIYLLTSYGIKVDCIFVNFFRFCGKIIFSKVLEKVVFNGQNKDLIIKNSSIVIKYFFFFIQKNRKYRDICEELHIFTELSTLSLILKIIYNIKSFKKKVKIKKMYNDRKSSLIFLKWHIKKKRISFFLKKELTLKKYLHLNIINMFFFGNNQYNYSKLKSFSNFFRNIFWEKQLVSEISNLLIDKLIIMKEKFFRRYELFIFNKINVFMNIKYLVSIKKNFDEFLTITRFYFKKIPIWNIFFIFLGFLNQDLENLLIYFQNTLDSILKVDIFYDNRKISFFQPTNIECIWSALNSFLILKPFSSILIIFWQIFFENINTNTSKSGISISAKKSLEYLCKLTEIVRFTLNRKYTIHVYSDRFVLLIIKLGKKDNNIIKYLIDCILKTHSIYYLDTQEHLTLFLNFFYKIITIQKKYIGYAKQNHIISSSKNIFLLFSKRYVFESSMKFSFQLLYTFASLPRFLTKRKKLNKLWYFSIKNKSNNFDRTLVVLMYLILTFMTKTQKNMFKTDLLILFCSILKNEVVNIMNQTVKNIILNVFFNVISKFYIQASRSQSLIIGFMFSSLLKREKIIWEKNFVLYELVVLFFSAINRTSISVSNTLNIQRILSFLSGIVDKEESITRKKNLYSIILFKFIEVQSNGIKIDILPLDGPLLNHNNEILLFKNKLFLEEKSRLFLDNNSVNCKPINTHKIIRIIKTNLQMGSSIFMLFHLRDVIVNFNKNVRYLMKYNKKSSLAKVFSETLL